MVSIHPRRVAATVLAATLAALAAGAATSLAPPRDGYVPRPVGTDETDIEMVEDLILLYPKEDFGGSSARLRRPTEKTPGRPHPLAGQIKDDLESLRWHLPDGVVVVMTEHAKGRGQPFVIWGEGQVRSLEPWDFQRKVSRWAWFYVGGADGASSEILRGAGRRPRAVKDLDVSLPEATLSLYSQARFIGSDNAVPVLDQPAGIVHPTPDGLGGVLRSARWNLPPGVVVVLYERPDGLGGQLAFWGSGRLDSMKKSQLGERFAAWAWFFVGTPPGAAEDGS